MSTLYLFIIHFQGVCECTLKYEGDRCEQERCLNGGRRHTIKGKVMCRCPFGLEGDRCEKVTYCEEGKGFSRFDSLKTDF